MPQDTTSQKKPEKIQMRFDQEGMKRALGQDAWDEIEGMLLRAEVEIIENEPRNKDSNS